MRRSPRLLLFALALLATSIGQPGLVAAVDPSSPALRETPPAAVGAVVLPSGRVLPVAPPGALGPSEMAEQLRAHANDRIDFKPGAMPRARSEAPATVTLADPVAGSKADLIPLAPADGSAASATLAASLPNGLKKQVFGFLPYWMLNASDLQWMRYGLVSTIAYFGVAARSDGSLATNSTGWNGWTSSAMTGVINAAHAKGDRVVLTVTMMAWDSASAGAQATLLGNATYRSRLVATIVAAVRNRNADGVNLDFEPLSTSLRSRYTAFVRQLKAALVGARVGSYLTVCTTGGAATWATGYDLAGLTATGAADGIFAMGYDYSWSGSSRAGGVAPMESSYMLDVNQSVSDFLSLMPAAKLIWGVPYYGRTWHTTSSALNATTVAGASGSSKAYYYTGAKSLAAAHGRRWDALGQVPWFSYYDSTARSWIEGYYDDAASLGIKYDMINRRGLAGLGVWHLNMDGGVSDLWNLIANKFQKDTMPPSGGIGNMPPVTDAYAIPVRWRAIDVGSGLASYTVQVRDRATTGWTTWQTNVTGTAPTYIGVPGHTYEFRVSAKDRLGNAQPWVPAMPNPGASLAAGGFASIAADMLNIRSGAGTAYDTLAQLAKGQRVAILSGPVPASGYQWYQVQFAFTEWPSVEYPRTGWAAAGDSGGAFLVPAVAPTVTTLSPSIAAYAPAARVFSPNGDGRSDTVSVSYSLPSSSSSVRLDVVNAAGALVRSVSYGAQGAGSHTATWDGRTASGAWASAGGYLLRLVATDARGTHFAPASWMNAALLGRWGVTADRTAPSATLRAPAGGSTATSSAAIATFSEPVTGVAGASLTLTDMTGGRAVAAAVVYDSAARTATLRPSAALLVNHAFRVSLTSGIRDAVGNALPPVSWTFTTVGSPITAYSPRRLLVFVAGTTIGYRFDSAGRITGSRSYPLSRTSRADASRRSKAIPGHPGAWFFVVNGVWADYWVQESPRVYLPGVAEQVAYAAPKLVSFAPGTYTGYRFNSAWQMSGGKRSTLRQSSTAVTRYGAVINGRAYVYLSSGAWAAYWMPVGGGIAVR